MEALTTRALTLTSRIMTTAEFLASILNDIRQRAREGYGTLQYDNVPTNICRETFIQELQREGFSVEIRPYAGLKSRPEFDILTVQWLI